MAYYFSDLQRFRREQLNPDMTDEELQQRKIENDQRLKRAFDHIFEKYNRNFDNIGDEIDLDKEEIVVNNGHIECMEHDRDDGKRTNRILTSLACGTRCEGEDETEFGDPSEQDFEEDSEEDNLVGYADGESSEGQNEGESPETLPSSADDLDNSIAPGEQSDDSHDPLSFEEYSASTKRQRSRLHEISNHIPPLRIRTAKSNTLHSPSVERTNQATASPSHLEHSQTTTAADHSHVNVTKTEDNLEERPRKRSRTVILEMPLWTQPELSRNLIPKTSWDHHWARKRNPKARTFDEHGNKIIRSHSRRGKNSVESNSKNNQSTSLITEVKAEVKLEHTCLSDEVASLCPACTKEEEGKCDTLLDDDRIIDPAVARRLLLEHTCFTSGMTGLCVACDKESQTQQEDEIDLVRSRQLTGESKTRRSLSSDRLNNEKSTPSRRVTLMDQHGGPPPQNADDRCDHRDDSDEELDEYDWENNSNVPKPQYITRIIKCYNKRKPFTPEEDRLIIQMYEEQYKGWDDIMEAIRHRSRGQLQYRYYTTLRSENWKEKRAAAADAIKQPKLIEAEKARRQKAAEASVRSFSGSLFEKSKKQSIIRCRNRMKQEDDMECEDGLKLCEPVNLALLPPPEDRCESPEFFPTVPPALRDSTSSYDNSQTSPDPSQVPAWLFAEPVPSQIEGIPMEPTTRLYRGNSQCTRIYPDSKSPTLAHVSEADSSSDETLECKEICENVVPRKATSVGTSYSNTVTPSSNTITKCGNCGLTKNKGYWRNAADGRRLCNKCGLYESRNGKPRPVGVKHDSKSMSEGKRQDMKVLPPNTREVNILAIPKTSPAEHIPSSPDPPQNSIYETDGSLEEVDLI